MWLPDILNVTRTDSLVLKYVKALTCCSLSLLLCVKFLLNWESETSTLYHNCSLIVTHTHTYTHTRVKKACCFGAKQLYTYEHTYLCRQSHPPTDIKRHRLVVRTGTYNTGHTQLRPVCVLCEAGWLSSDQVVVLRHHWSLGVCQWLTKGTMELVRFSAMWQLALAKWCNNLPLLSQTSNSTCTHKHAHTLIHSPPLRPPHTNWHR